MSCPHGARQVAVPPAPPPERIQQLLSLLPRWATELIHQGKQKGDDYESREEADAAACAALVAADATDAEILWFYHASPDGIGAAYHSRSDGAAYLSTTIDLARSGAQAAAYVVIRCVTTGGPSGNVTLRLEVGLGSPYAGVVFAQVVEPHLPSWAHLFRAVGLPVPPYGAVEQAITLSGRWAAVRLGTSPDRNSVQVLRWLPAVQR